MMKGIMVGSKKYPKIKGFTEVPCLNNLFANLTILSGNGYYFWANNILLHSNYSQHQLKAELDKEKDRQGIQASGATRFY
jgi:hypothetical protein